MALEEYILAEREKLRDEGYQKAMQTYWQELFPHIREYGFYTINLRNLVKENEMIGVSFDGISRVPKSRDELVFHNHDYFELVYVYRGHYVNHFQDRELHMYQGDLLLLNPHMLHSVYTTGEEDVVFNIVLSPQLFETALMPMLADNRLFSRFFSNYFYQVNRTQDYLLFSAPQIPQIGHIIRSILEEYRNRSLCYQNVILAELVLLFAMLTRSYSEQHDIRPEMGEKAQFIADVLAYIHQNCRDITLSEAAEAFSYSPGHLSKLIQKHTGKAFSDLVRHFRLEQVREALDAGTVSMEEILQLSGFNDRSYLDKSFKKHFGVTPSQYRKSKNNENR